MSADIDERLLRLVKLTQLAGSPVSDIDAGHARALADHLLGELSREFRAQTERIEELERVTSEQAEDDGLWFLAETITEDYLQKALRRLHAVIEGIEPDEAARRTLEGA